MPDAPSLDRAASPVILGLNVPTTGIYSHNASAALVRGGEILALCEQERLDRIKDSGRFPAAAIHSCLKTAGIGMPEVDAIALAKDPYFVQSRIGTVPDETFFILMYQKLISNFGRVPDVLLLVNHHLSHAASCFYPCGAEQSLVITWDGGGDNQHTVAYRGNADGIVQLQEHPYSMGNLYNKFRRHMNLSDKGSLMGLASYGKKEPGSLAGYYDADQVWISPGLQFARGGEYIIDPDLLRAVGAHRLPDTPINGCHAQTAAYVQHAVEKLSRSIVDKALARYPSRTLCLAGGVALNATFNGVLWREGIFDDIFIQPGAHDGGLSLGAALEAVRILTGTPPRCERMRHAAYGPSFNDEDIAQTLKICRLESRRLDDDALLDQVAGWLADGLVIGWFQGRMEWGPRALGNRSILADPRRKEMADKVNQIVKYRDEWRPFALSILAEKAQAYLDNPCPDPFMITTAPVREDKREAVAAVTHADNTTRPQFVDQKTAPRYHALIGRFAEKTGVHGLLNTSFNLKGEPIVCTPKDAVRTFFSSGLEILVLGNHIVQKPR